jgi:MFS family permease
MRRFSSLIALLLVLSFLVSPVLAATGSSAPAPVAAPTAPAKADKSPVAGLAGTLSTVTGIAISPLLGTSVYGAYQYFKAPDDAARAKLPWYAQLTFWLPGLLIVTIVACKDSLGTVLPPGFKKPLDVLETIENKASGLVAAGAVVPFTMDTFSKLVTSQLGSPQVESINSGLATLTMGAIDLSWLLNILTIPFGIFMFVVVWMASHAINVLILLSPWGAIDAALKGARTALLGLLTLSAMINPWVGAILSLIIIVVSYLIAGWAFRLTIFGSVFCWDFFTFRKHRTTPVATGNLMFSGNLLTKSGVPVRTYGSLTQTPEAGAWTFTYRPWLVGPVKSVQVDPKSSQIGCGLFISTIRREDGSLFILPPRYRGHEEQLVALYAIAGGVQPAGILKAWGSFKELFTGSSSKAQVA